MAYELKPGQGTIFKNERKEQEKHPDYRGEVACPLTGTVFKLAAWVREAKSGRKFLSASLEAPREQQGGGNNAGAFDDDPLPF